MRCATSPGDTTGPRRIQLSTTTSATAPAASASMACSKGCPVSSASGRTCNRASPTRSPTASDCNHTNEDDNTLPGNQTTRRETSEVAPRKQAASNTSYIGVIKSGVRLMENEVPLDSGRLDDGKRDEGRVGATANHMLCRGLIVGGRREED